MNQKTGISLSPSAAERIAHIIEQKGNKVLAFRVSVLGGGCSGFQYELGFDDTMNDDDILVEENGARLVTDTVSLPYLSGATLDYVRDMMGARFEIKNPNAVSGCGCGQSFAV